MAKKDNPLYKELDLKPGRTYPEPSITGIQPKPLCFDDKPGCDAEYLQAKGQAAIDASLQLAVQDDPAYPELQSYYPNEFDVQRTTIRSDTFATVVRYICTTGLAIYLFHLLKPLIR